MKSIRLPSAYLYGTFAALVLAAGVAGMRQLLPLAGYAIVAAVILASLGLGSLIVKLVGVGEDAHERDCFAIAAGLQPLWVIPLLLGYLNLLTPTYLLAILVLLAIAGLPASAVAFPRLLRSARPANWRSPFTILLAVILLVYLLHSLLPAVFFDALHYHLSVPAQALVTGRLVNEPNMHGATYPMGAEFLALYGMAAGDDGALKKINFFLLLLLLVFVGRAIGNKGRGASIAQLVLASSPLFGYAATVEFIDIELTLYLVFFVHAMLVSSSSDNPKPYLFAAALFAGSAMAVKYTAMPFIGITALLWAWRRWTRLAGELRSILLASIICVLIPLPWYAKTYVQTGNPVFPYFNSVFKSDLAPEKPLSSKDDMHGYRVDANRFSPLRFLRYPVEVSTQISRGGMLSDPGVVIILLLPLLLFKPPKSVYERDALVLSLAFFLSWWLLSGYLIRYVCVIFLFLAASIGRALDELLEEEQAALGRLAMAALSLGLLFNMSIYLQQMTKYFKAPAYIVGELPREGLLRETITYYPVSGFVNDNLPEAARILFVGERRCYYFRRQCVVYNYFVENPLATAIHQSSGPGATRRALLDKGITHVLVNHRHIETISGSNPVHIPNESLDAISRFLSTLERVYADDRYAVYSLAHGRS